MTDADDLSARIVDAFLGRLGSTPLREIELADVARDAGVSLADLRARFDSRLAILAEHMRRTDLAVLERHDPQMASEPERDRMFDVLMRRLDALAPHKDAMRMLTRTVTRDPMLAACLNPLVVRSMAFMLAEAGVPTVGAAGRLRAQGLAVAWIRILDVFVEDDDPGLARTMVAVDKALTRGEQVAGFAERVRGTCRRMGEGFRRGRPGRRPGAEEMAGSGI